MDLETSNLVQDQPKNPAVQVASLLPEIPLLLEVKSDKFEPFYEKLFHACEAGIPGVLALVAKAILMYPTNPELLHIASLSALLEEKPDTCLRYQKRLEKNYGLLKHDHLMRAIAAAQKKQWMIAYRLADGAKLFQYRPTAFFPDNTPTLVQWASKWLMAIRKEEMLRVKAASAGDREVKKIPTKATSTGKKSVPPRETPVVKPEPPPLPVEELPRFPVEIAVRFQVPRLEALPVDLENSDGLAVTAFRLREELLRFGLLQGFDELLCLPYLHQIQTYWYQVETVRKVLKQFRGRVLLADEVGLGKTIEAGMVLKEYLLRGMVDRVLILTPASLVGQWRDEMESKFELDFVTSYDSLLRTDAPLFWGQKRVIASIATARRKEHFSLLTQLNYDLVIVDEAHHLKNRITQNWKLVDALQKRFLILLSATPIQNSLLELYNLLTLLKPGIFATEKEFRTAYMTPHKPRVPINRERLRDLLREVMIRNTRSLVDVRLPPRQAVTLRLTSGSDEQACYAALNDLVQFFHQSESGNHRLALHHLLLAAGSSPQAAQAGVARFAARFPQDPRWQVLLEQYQRISGGIKEAALLQLLERNPLEKKMIFLHQRETLERLDAVLRAKNIPFARFDGSLSGLQKDAAIADFCDRVPVLLCTESGGEGRNLQFCNTIINFDLPWNPMAIEQRIGRIHRIGQSREVFVFNLVVSNTVEDHVLKILDDKINMFELVVGEVGAILGEIDDVRDFSEVIFSAWVESGPESREAAFAKLGEQMADAKRQYEEIKILDENLFGQEFETG